MTLAEVLITMAIIGVVCAMTIPTLMQKKFEQETTTKLKKAYSTLSNAYTLAAQENGTPDTWSLGGDSDPTGALNILTNFSPFLHITKNCGSNSGCFPSQYNYLQNLADTTNYNTWSAYSKAQLSDGTIVAFTVRDANCLQPRGGTQILSNTCAIALVDINGLQGPNRHGVDAFWFTISKYGIVPHGTQFDTSQTFSATCRDKTTATGTGCAAWVIYNENLDYLHCNNLSWSGPTKCQ